MFRERGGRKYVYREGTKVAPGWLLKDEEGNVYKTFDEYKEKNKPKKKVVRKKAVVKETVETDNKE